MGLLGKAIAIQNARSGSVAAVGDFSGGVQSSVQSSIDDFHRKNPLFHVIVLQESDASRRGDISAMIACHGGKVAGLPGGNTLVLLPGALDRELFAHRLSRSAGLAEISQLSADSPSLALETLGPYLQ